VQTCWEIHQETEKGYVALTRGYGGYTLHEAISIVPIVLISPRSFDAGLGSHLYPSAYRPYAPPFV